MTEIEGLMIRVERLEQEIAKIKENPLEYIDMEELYRKLATQIGREKFTG